MNLVNSTEWNKIDILFTSPNMLNLIMSIKDKFDYYDINPECVVIDDFDYIMRYY